MRASKYIPVRRSVRFHPGQLHDYQVAGIDFMLRSPRGMIWLRMGRGKTILVLSALLPLFQAGYLTGVLVLAPRRVCRAVWRQQAQEWSHTTNLTFSLVVGTPGERTYALMTRAHIYLINYECIPWLVRECQIRFLSRGYPLPFNGLVCDEISRLKKVDGVRLEHLTALLPHFPFRWGLTGTPAGNGLADLQGQYRVIDDGARFGVAPEEFQERFCTRDKQGRRVVTPRMKRVVEEIIGDVTFQVGDIKPADIEIPLVNEIVVELPEAARRYYDTIEAELFVTLDSGHPIYAPNTAVAMDKCRQIAGGHIYPFPGDKHYEVIHDAKLEALDEVVEECAGQPLLVGYGFRHEATRLMEWARKRKLRVVDAVDTKLTIEEIEARWTQGDIDILQGNPMSLGHGLNLQHGGSILVFYCLIWALDPVQQFIARLARQGQTHKVVAHYITATNTIDEVMREVLVGKATTQENLQLAVYAYREAKYGRAA